MESKKRGLIFVLLVVFLSTLSVSTLAAGCILHPNNADMYCVENAGADQQACAGDARCVTSPQSCSVLPDCDLVSCGTTEGCSLEYRGLCDQVLTAEDEAAWCFPGCCMITKSDGSPLCEFGTDFFQCRQLSTSILGPSAAEPRFFPSDQATCLNQCGVSLQQASLTVIVLDEEFQPLSATIVMNDIVRNTDSSGKYTFTPLEAGVYQATASSPDFVEQKFSVSLAPGEAAERTIYLQKPGLPGKISGHVFFSQAGEVSPLPGATITISGIQTVETTSLADGAYQQDFLSPGTYTVTASHPEYGSGQRTITISAGEDLLDIDFTLQGVVFTGVKGRVLLNGNPVPGANIFINGQYKALSRDSGNYQVSLPADGQIKTIRATYAGYYQAESTFQLTESLSVMTIDLDLQIASAVCSSGNWLDATGFTYQFIPGQPEVQLSWQQPCPEVIGYELIRTDEAGQESRQIFNEDISSFWDSRLAWGASYTYTLTTIYRFEGRTYTSAGVSVSVTMGDEVCATYTLGQQFCEDPSSEDEFSELGVSSSSSEIGDPIFACGPDNRFQQIDTCEEGFCASDRVGGTTCLADTSCKEGGKPFGLYYSENICYYGASSSTSDSSASDSSSYSVFSSSDDTTASVPTKFCYYDYFSPSPTAARTTVDQCLSCGEVQNCFDYQSKNACEFNSCLTQNCLWVDAADTRSESPLVDYGSFFDTLQENLGLPSLDESSVEQVTKETGAGFCVPEKYNDDQYCSLCSPDNVLGGEGVTLFENNLCTPDICSSLGRCFSNPLGNSQNLPLLSYCEDCGDYPSQESSCYTYTSELECVNDNAISATNGVISESNDSCSWGRCYWDGSSCVKDGNFDEEDDCADGSVAACKLDVSPPVTTLLGGSLPAVSLGSPTVTFEGNDQTVHDHHTQQHDLARFGYCLSPVSSPESCSTFTVLDYTGRTGKESITINILEKITEKKDGEIYRISYYSEDEYFNRESVKQDLLYVDNTVPNFVINQTIMISQERAKIKVWLQDPSPLDPSELMSCSFNLSLPNADVALQSVEKKHDEVKAVEFDELANIVWVNVNVTCTDLVGNYQSKEKKYTLDLEDGITLLHPLLDGVLAETTIPFEVETTLDSECTLRRTDTNELVAQFNGVGDSRKHHLTEPLPGFAQGTYFQQYKVVCQSFATQEDIEDHFQFTVDLTPPTTQIILTEGTREYRPVTRVWEASFINSATVDFSCSAEGFPCDKTYYCLGAENDLLSCPPFPNENYVPYESGKLIINQTSRICYYSTDTAGNKVFSANCGTVFINGFGLLFDFPPVYTYEGEKWVISPHPVFDWQFSTLVPSAECTFSFTPEFNYDDVLDVQRIQQNANGKYLVRNFPQNVFKSYPDNGGIYDIYIRCLSTGGELSPEHHYIFEYDPNFPDITEAFADPDLIFEIGQTKTNIFAMTDLKTLCKYSDDSDGSGSSEYESMEYAFPGLVEKILYREHEDIFSLNSFSSPDGKKTFTLNTQCSSGAGLLSPVEQIIFNVDYSSAGFISVLRAGDGGEYVYSSDVPLYVETSRNAICEYEFAGSYQQFSETGGKIHQHVLMGVPRGSYQIPVRCTMEGNHVAEGEISFTIDLTPPTITSIDDGSYTCGSETINLLVYTDEENLASYYYEVYYRQGRTSNGSAMDWSRQNNSKNYSLAPVAELVLNGTSVGLPITIDLLSLTSNLSEIDNSLFTTKVWATDAAGNKGLPATSDGIVVTENSTICSLDQSPPRIDVTSNESCSGVLAEMHCYDAIGCKAIIYGKSRNENECTMNTTYDGKKISFDQTGYLCYAARDYQDNTHNGTKKISFSDDDGDGVENSCDLCTTTSSGIITGYDGCGFSEVPDNETNQDEDGDGLPNYWEAVYDSESCPLKVASADSDMDVIADGAEDYDGDGTNNYHEYLGGSNPCLASDMPPDWKVQEPPWGEYRNLSSGLGGETPPRDPRLPVGTPEGTPLVPLIFLIVGAVLMSSGIGYLTYFYNYSPQSRTARSSGVKQPSRLSSAAGSSTPALPASSKETPERTEKAVTLRNQRMKRERSRKREGLFSEFGSSGSGAAASSAKGEEAGARSGKSAAQQAGKDTSNASASSSSKGSGSDQEKQGKQEKSIFQQLAGLATGTKDADVQKVLEEKASGKKKDSAAKESSAKDSSAQDDDLFTKLKKLTKNKK